MKRRLDLGFTLLEMLVVIAVIALVAATSIPSLKRPSDRMRLEFAAREMVGVLRSVRAQAIARDEPLKFILDADRRIYEAPRHGVVALPADMEIKFIAGGQRGEAAQSAIEFFPGGGTSGGEVQMRIGAARGAILVNWLTGSAEAKL